MEWTEFHLPLGPWYARIVNYASDFGNPACVTASYRPATIPISCTALMMPRNACRRMHVQSGLSFLQSDAESIDFGGECFDVVINVEASHLYGHVEKFFAEVYRILRPGGFLLLSDKRTSEQVPFLDRQIESCAWQVIAKHDISANGLRSVRLQREERIQLLQRLLPGNLAWIAIHLIGVDGSHLANALATGESVYQSFVIRKF